MLCAVTPPHPKPYPPPSQVTACNMLCCYAEELREGFLPYVQPVTEIMVPLLKFWFHEEVCGGVWGGGRGEKGEGGGDVC